jgi:hypothetical protein
MSNELRTCGVCRSMMLLKFYSTNIKTHIMYKSCDDCRAKHRAKTHVCDECDKEFGVNGTLQRHIKTVHLGENNYICGECDQKFGAKSDLQRHIKQVRRGERNYACGECDHKFGAKSDLQRHIKTIHSGEKNYACCECDHKFGTNAILQNHIKQVNRGERDHVCTECDQKFGRKGDLRKHIKICTGKFNGSAGEHAIMTDGLGLEQDIDFIYDQTFWNVKDESLLRWDFIINHKHENDIVIEYDGEFHYKPIRMGNMSDEEAQTALENTQRRNKITDDYCESNNKPLLRIPCWETDNNEQLVTAFIAAN